MKKSLLILLSLALVLSFVGCKQNAVEDKNNVNSENNNTELVEEKEPEVLVPHVEGTLEELMVKVYEGTGLEFPNFANTVVDLESLVYYLGSEEIKYKEALASEPMMSSIAHSVVLVRVEDLETIEDTKALIKENVDGRKWICVGVEPDDIIVENIGDLIILIMDTDNGELILESFNSLNK